MTRNKLSGTRTENMKCTACNRLMSVSRICSLSQLIRNRSVSEGKESNFTEKRAFGAETSQKESYENYNTDVRKTVAFCLPSLIRIRATDREGNSIEVTY
jgi:hypothetical protein